MNDSQFYVAQIAWLIDHGRHTHFMQAFQERGIFEHGQHDDAYRQKLMPDITQQRHGELGHDHVAGRFLQI